MSVHTAIDNANAVLPGQPAPEGEQDPRWQAIIEVGKYIESDPEEVWQFILQWGGHADDDLRAAIACCLLEHLLENEFESIFPRVERAVKADSLFGDTFCMCWKFGRTEFHENSEKFDALTEWHERRSTLEGG